MEKVDYVDTLILVADDCPVARGTEPPVKHDNPSIAARQFAMIREQPYTHTSADVIFGVHADRQGLPGEARPDAREAYFSKSRACLRASDLGKKYGWGLHCDAEGRIAVYGVESPTYAELVERSQRDGLPKLVKAMRSSRK